MWNLEKWYRWTYLQGRNRDTDTENQCVDPRQWGRRWVWDEMDTNLIFAQRNIFKHLSLVWDIILHPGEWCFSNLKPYKVTSSCLWDSELGLGGQASQADPGHFLFSLCVSLPFFFVLHSPSSHGLLFTLKITDFKNASVAVNFVCIWFYGFVELLELN